MKEKVTEFLLKYLKKVKIKWGYKMNFVQLYQFYPDSEHLDLKYLLIQWTKFACYNVWSRKGYGKINKKCIHIDFTSEFKPSQLEGD